MGNNKLVKFIMIFTIIFMIFTLITSKNEAHLDHCNDKNCEICSIIHIAQIIVRSVFIQHIKIFIILFLYNVFIKISNLRNDNMTNSLLFQRVQFNE